MGERIDDSDDGDILRSGMSTGLMLAGDINEEKGDENEGDPFQLRLTPREPLPCLPRLGDAPIPGLG
jgi:hypothetical protein